MNETLINILNKAMELAEQTGEFIVTQGNDLLTEFYAWETASNAFLMVLYIILSIAAVWGLLKSYRIYKLYPSENDGAFGIYIATACSLIIFIPAVFYYLYELLFVLIAPKLYLLHYLIALQNGGGC